MISKDQKNLVSPDFPVTHTLSPTSSSSPFFFLWACVNWCPKLGPLWGICWLPLVIPLCDSEPPTPLTAFIFHELLAMYVLTKAIACLRNKNLNSERKGWPSRWDWLFISARTLGERHGVKNSVEGAWLPEVKWKAPRGKLKGRTFSTC